MPTDLILSRADQTRLTRLARAANRTPEEVLRFILDNGLSEAALLVHKVTASRSAAARGEVIPHAAAMRRARAVIERHAGTSKKTA